MQGNSKGNSGPYQILKKGKLSSDLKSRHSGVVTKRNDLCLPRQMIILVFDSLTNLKWNLWLVRQHETVSCKNILVVKLPACLF